MPLAHGAGAGVTVAFIDVFVFAFAGDYRTPDGQEVFAQAAQQPARWMLPRVGLGNLPVQEQRGFVDPHSKAHFSEREPIAHETRAHRSVALCPLCCALAWSSRTGGKT